MMMSLPERWMTLAAIPAMLCSFACSSNAASCADKGTPETNTALVKTFYAALDKHRPDLLDKVLDEQWIDIPAAPGQGAGRAGMKEAMAGYYVSFPDFHVVNEDFVAQDGKVLVRSTIRATQRGIFAGIPATDKAITIMAMDLHEICHGRVVRTWHVEDWLSGLFQVGALPPANPGARQ